MGFRAELAKVKATTQKKRVGQMTRSCLKFWIKMRRMMMMMGLHMVKNEAMSRKRVRKSRKSCWDTRIWWLSEYARLTVSLFLDAFVICRDTKQSWSYSLLRDIRGFDFREAGGAGAGICHPSCTGTIWLGTLCGESALLRGLAHCPHLECDGEMGCLAGLLRNKAENIHIVNGVNEGK